MMKKILITFLFLSFSVCYSQNSDNTVYHSGKKTESPGKRFQYVGKVNNETIHFDTKTMSLRNRIFIDVWVKFVLKKPEIDESNRKIQVKMEHLRISTRNRMMKTIGVIHYNKSGEVIYSEQEEHDWQNIAPASIGEEIRDKVLKYFNEY